MKSNWALRLLGVTIFGIFGLWLIKTILFPVGFSMGVNFGNNNGGGSISMGFNYGAASTVSFLLLLLIKVFFVLFIIGLTVGIVIAVKNYIFTEEDIAQLKGTFKVKETTEVKTTCTECGRELKADWKSCPYCGKEK